MNLLKSKRVIIFILLIGLVVRLFFFFVLTPWDRQALEQTTEQLHFDAAKYNSLALSIWKTNSLKDFGVTRTPGYPFLIAFFYYLFGLGGAWLVLIFQIILDLITVYLVYLIGKRISSSLWVGPAAAFLYATSFPTALYSNLLLTEIPFAFFIILTVWLLIRALGHPQKSFWLLGVSGLTLGIATLIRPLSQYLPIVIILFWLIVALYQRKIPSTRKTLGRSVGEVAIFLFVFIIVISPWLIRNKNLYGYWSLSVIGGWNICAYNASYLKSDIEGISIVEAQEYFKREREGYDNTFAAVDNCKQKAIKYILSNLTHYIPLHLKGTLNIFLGVGRADILYLLGKEVPSRDFLQGNLTTKIIEEIKHSKEQYFLVPILGIRQLLEYLLFLIGVVVLFARPTAKRAKKNGRNRKLSALLIILFFVYLTILIGPVGYSRFRIPIVPLYLLFSAYGLIFVISKLRRRLTSPSR